MRKISTLVFAAGIVAGCSGSASDGGGVAGSDPAGRAEQATAFAKLQDSTQRSWTWVQHDTLATPAHLSAERVGAPLLKKGDDVAARTIAFLEENRALFKMRAPAVEMSLSKSHVDHLGMTHARFQQMTHGVPVAGREVYAHYDSAGRITSIDADYVPGLESLEVEPALGPADAVSRARAAVFATSTTRGGAALASSAVSAGEGPLVVYAPNGAATARLAYKVRVRAMSAAAPAIWVTMVDANTGAVLHRYNDLKTVEGAGVGVLGDKKTFQVTSEGTRFVMTDTSGGVEISTFTAAQDQTTPGTALSSRTATSWDTGVIGAGAAVDAHVNAENVFRYYKDHHARNAIDGAGGAMVSTVHYGTGYDNAAWDGGGMLYGDGATQFRPLSLALDVVGHEFTHGVTESTSNLQYETQSGALNEAVSDIFGAFIEHATAPDPKKNWLIAEAIVKVGGPLRDMSVPESVSDPQPGHMGEFVTTQEDNGGVHINSGIINNAAFLMTVGGTNPVSKIALKFGIGWEKSEKIWYRADTVYFKETTSFGQAAQGVLQASKDVGLTDNEIAIVDCAFKAVGVEQGKCAEITDPAAKPTSTDPVQRSGAPSSTDPDNGKGVPPGATGAGAKDAPAGAGDPGGTRKKIVETEESGCNASGAGARAANPSPWLALLGAVALLSAARRGRRRRS